MVDYRPARKALLATPFLVAILAASSLASARALQVRDEAHVLSTDEIGRLRSDVASAPFDARLVVTTEHPTSQDLGSYVHQLVNEGDLVIVGLDPEHHHVQVRFGTGSGVPEASWSTIEKSGNDAFRRGDWEGGAAAIFRAASSAVSTGPSGVLDPAQRVGPSRAGPGMVLLVIGGFIGIALLASFFFRRRGFAPGPAAYGPGYGPPPYGGGGYGYGGPPAGGMGPVGGGLIGAGLGGLAGYELGKLEGERDGRDRDGGFGGSSNQGGGDAGGNYDAGGGGSDWDAGGGGGGGGFDGGDGGGGGSDF
jgi:hypothetical protein